MTTIRIPRRRALALALLCLVPAALLSACNGGNPGGGVEPMPVRPLDPSANDVQFGVAGVPRYLLASDGLTPATASFALRVTAPGTVSKIDLWLDNEGAPLPLSPDGADFVVSVPAAALSVGRHTLMLGERDAAAGFFKADFLKGHALYVMISTDWDFSDVDDRVLDHHTMLHEKHPELKITHLIGPYTFTDPAVPQARRDAIVAWAKGMRDNHADEIGLHVHPRCTFVDTTGIPCLSKPSVANPDGDDTGYTVRLGAYTREQWRTMFEKANQIWDQVGFGKPVSFRAGAWTLETHVAQALADTGFKTDSSAVNWRYLEEWKGEDLFDWNMKQWSPIGDTSQPYRPTEGSIVPGGAGAPIDLLEVPDNGAMVDYWTVDEMKRIFDANWSGQALAAPIQVSTGFHPAPTEYYSRAEYNRLDAFFAYIDQFLASKAQGPVRYIRMADATRIWP